MDQHSGVSATRYKPTREQLRAARELHAVYYREFERPPCPTLRKRVGYLLRRTRRRLTGYKHGWHKAQTFAHEIADNGGPSLLRQYLAFRLLNALYGTSAELFYRFRMYEWQNARQVELYFETNEYMALQSYLFRRLKAEGKFNGGKLADKRTFCELCAAADLPTIPLLAEFEGGVETRWYPNAETWLDGDLFSKPVRLKGGEGAQRWKCENGRYRDASGIFLTLSELRDQLAQRSAERPFILQPRIRHHRAIDALSGEALCTARAITVRPAGGKPELLRAIFKMSTGTAAVDNFQAGGIGSPIDPATGALGLASRRSPWHAPQLSRHPDTGERIDGFVLPGWHEVKQLAVRAHEAFAEFPSIGWDIAITERGPVIVEGNYNSGLFLAQVPHRQPLGATKYPLYYLSVLGAETTGGRHS
jgi:hypothetical protein